MPRWGFVVAGSILPTLVVAQLVFKPSATAVRVDVQVVDQNGRIVPDIRQSEFEVREDGARQALSVFLPPDSNSGSSRSSVTTARQPMQEHETMLVVLGRGRLEVPSKGLTALDPLLEAMVQRGASVGFAAYNRIVGPTKDLASLRRFVARYRERHELIESAIDNWFWGLTGIYGGGETPRWIDDLVDQVFDAPGLPASRVFPRIDAPERPEFDQIRQEMEETVGRANGGGRTLIEANQDLAKLNTAIEALRYVEGRKSIVFLTDQPPAADRVARMNFVGRLASDGGIRVSVIQTGGSPGEGWIRDERGQMSFSGRTFDQLFALTDARDLAVTSGGQFSAYQMASKAVEKILAADDGYYILGYEPPDASAKADGKYHDIKVSVSRPGVSVSYRHGYYRLPLVSAADARAEMGRQRISAAYRDPHDLPDVSFSITLTTTTTGTRVKIEVDPKTVSFRGDKSSEKAALEVGVAAVETDRVLAHTQAALDSTPTNSRSASSRITYTAELPGVVRRGTRVKVVVYDVTDDKLGSRWKEIR